MWAACVYTKIIFLFPLSGPWLDAFGLGEAAQHIGTLQSIAIRNPDCTVATHLINMVIRQTQPIVSLVSTSFCAFMCTFISQAGC